MRDIETLTAALAGRYEIEREIGAGGMATVYLARDLKHDRRVALKLLKPELGAVLGVERFLAEIKVTAKLQHPNLLPLFDSGEVNGLLFYVMPFVDGETLRARLDREKQLPVDEALRIAMAVAGALAYAHEHGVIHRDLKPENILMQAGQPVIADFGIALAVSKAGGARVTRTGMSLGTPQYMSPEQAAGDRAIDARSDIYSLAAVTYEMLAGEPPHSGTSAQAIIAKLLTVAPQPLSSLRKSAPAHVEAALDVALAKLPADRFGSAIELAAALANPAFRVATAAGVKETASSRRAHRLVMPLVAVAAMLLISTFWGWLRPAPAKLVTRYMLTPDPGSLPTTAERQIALSPDGSRLVYTGGPRWQLSLRPRDQLHATPLPGTERASSPFFAPDGEQVGFFVDDSLKIVSLAGGASITITDACSGYGGGAWGPGDLICAKNGAGLVRVPARAGGRPTRLTVLNTVEGEIQHFFPASLPNGKGVLFTIWYNGRKHPESAIAVADVATGQYTVLVDGTRALYAESGHLVYATRTGTLMVAPFDPDTRTLTGSATAVIEGVRLAFTGGGQFAVSKTGTLIYAAGVVGTQRELVWVARDGTEQPVDPLWQDAFADPSLSPDGTRLAITIGDARAAQVWVKQLDRGPSLKLPSEGTVNEYPSWTPDGRSVTYSSNAMTTATTSGGARLNLWTSRADASAHAMLQLHQSRNVAGSLWSRDANWLIYRTDVEEAGHGDILAMHLGVDTVPLPLAATQAAEWTPTLSPDGRFLAYVSTETGSPQLVVVPFPNVGTAKFPVSTSGAIEPTWSHRGDEIFYRDRNANMVSVEVKTTPTFALGRSTVLFSAAGFAVDSRYRQYAVAPDGQRFLMIRQLGGDDVGKLLVVDNWFEELKARDRGQKR